MDIGQIFGSPKGPKFGTIQVSGSISETHTRTAQVSKSPIESGSEISDHRRVQNITVSIDGIATSHTNSLAEDLLGDQDSAGDVYNKLLELFDNTDVFQLVTGLEVYDDVVFTSLVITRDKTTGGTDTIRFKADIEQLRFATSDFALVPIDAAKKGTANVGKKPTSPAPASAASAVKADPLVISKESFSSFKDSLNAGGITGLLGF